MPVSILLRVFFWLWFGAAIAAGHFLVLRRLPPVAMPVMVVVLAAMILSAYHRISAVRTWVDALDLRLLVLLHVTRLLGIYFLSLFQQGELPRAFAVPVGVGDIIVASMALPVALAPLTDALRRRAIVIWNVVGFVGILLAVMTAFRLNLNAPLALLPLSRLPLSLWPTFFAPLILATHLIIFMRTSTPRSTD
jgi:hypothetical protein